MKRPPARAPGNHAPDAAGFAPALLAFYDRARRDLPWRRRPDPYRTLVSELMLQQTVVATVIPYFERFVARFPDLPALAAAEEDEVLTLWSGLGYYARARNLHRTARQVWQRHAGQLPATEAELRELPGLGPYTAAAVAAIGFQARTVAVDGNAARVLARLFGCDDPIDQPAARARLRTLGETLAPARRCGDFVQAIMELGALVCVPTEPRCGDCPVTSWCEARRSGRQRELPRRSPRAAKRKVALVCAAVEQRGRLLLVRREAGTLLGGTWTLPSEEVASDESSSSALARALAPLGLALDRVGNSLGAIRHIFTHRDVTARVVRVTARGQARDPGRWVQTASMGHLALSTFTRKTLSLVPTQDPQKLPGRLR
jgi:A/G-specific adenine glycosylase